LVERRSLMQGHRRSTWKRCMPRSASWRWNGIFCPARSGRPDYCRAQND